MATRICTYAIGRWVELARLPKGTDRLGVIPLQTTSIPSDTNLRNCQYLSQVWALGALEATFTNYLPRKLFEAADITHGVNTSTFQRTVTLAVKEWLAAGGAVNNAFSRALVVYLPTVDALDSAIECLALEDFSGGTTGGKLTCTIGVLTGSAPA